MARFWLAVKSFDPWMRLRSGHFYNRTSAGGAFLWEQDRDLREN